MQPTDIDPALALMAEFGQVTKGTTRHINQMRQAAIVADGTRSSALLRQFAYQGGDVPIIVEIEEAALLALSL